MEAAVEFAGGPLDGYVHPVDFAEDELQLEIALEMAPEVLRVLAGETALMTGATTSIAIYRLCRSESRLQYRHVCSVAAGKKRAEHS